MSSDVMHSVVHLGDVTVDGPAQAALRLWTAARKSPRKVSLTELVASPKTETCSQDKVLDGLKQREEYVAGLAQFLNRLT